MKKMFKVASSVMLVGGSLAGCGSSSNTSAMDTYGCDTISVFNVGEYIDLSVNDSFEREFGAKVIYETFDSNEAAYLKMTTGSYDVVVPSDYMIERLIGEDLLQPLDKAAIPNLANVNEEVMGWDFDADNTYSAPYFWGTVGIVYNKNNVDIKDLEKEGFGIFTDEKYAGKLYAYDSERDSFMMALKNLGYSMNTEDPAELEAAYNWLKDMKLTMQPSIVTDEVIDAMANGQKDFALMYSGDAAYVLSENEDMGYFLPNEGTNFWVDSMVIPKNATCAPLANEYINYMLDDEIAMKNSELVGYTSSNKMAMTELSSEGGYYYENPAYLVPEMRANDEIFHYNAKIKQVISEYWLKAKAAK